MAVCFGDNNVGARQLSLALGLGDNGCDCLAWARAVCVQLRRARGPGGLVDETSAWLSRGRGPSGPFDISSAWLSRGCGF